MLKHLDPLQVSICVGTVNTQFHPHTIPQKSTTKHKYTLVTLRLASGCHGRFSSQFIKALQIDFKLLY